MDSFEQSFDIKMGEAIENLCAASKNYYVDEQKVFDAAYISMKKAGTFEEKEYWFSKLE